MSVTYATTLKNTRMSAVGVAVDAGAGAGLLELGTTAMAATLVTFTLGDPSVSGSATAGAIVFAGFPKTATAVAAGTLVNARMRDSNNTDVITDLKVSTTSVEIVVDNTSVATAQLVVISSITITHG